MFTNEPTFDWHQQNIEHYEWKRTLARQAIAVPGNFYPEDRFLRAYMMKSGMQDMGLMGTLLILAYYIQCSFPRRYLTLRFFLYMCYVFGFEQMPTSRKLFP